MRRQQALIVRQCAFLHLQLRILCKAEPVFIAELVLWVDVRVNSPFLSHCGKCLSILRNASSGLDRQASGNEVVCLTDGVAIAVVAFMRIAGLLLSVFVLWLIFVSRFFWNFLVESVDDGGPHVLVLTWSMFLPVVGKWKCFVALHELLLRKDVLHWLRVIVWPDFVEVLDSLLNSVIVRNEVDRSMLWLNDLLIVNGCCLLRREVRTVCPKGKSLAWLRLIDCSWDICVVRGNVFAKVVHSFSLLIGAIGHVFAEIAFFLVHVDNCLELVRDLRVMEACIVENEHLCFLESLASAFLLLEKLPLQVIGYLKVAVGSVSGSVLLATMLTIMSTISSWPFCLQSMKPWLVGQLTERSALTQILTLPCSSTQIWFSSIQKYLECSYILLKPQKDSMRTQRLSGQGMSLIQLIRILMCSMQMRAMKLCEQIQWVLCSRMNLVLTTLGCLLRQLKDLRQQLYSSSLGQMKLYSSIFSPVRLWRIVRY